MKLCPFCGKPPRHLESKVGFYTERAICNAYGLHLTATKQITPYQYCNRRGAVEVTDDMVARAAQVYHPSNFGNKNQVLVGTSVDDTLSTKHMIRQMLLAALNTES